MAHATFVGWQTRPAAIIIYGRQQGHGNGEPGRSTAVWSALRLWGLSGDVGDDEFAQVAYLGVDVGDVVLDDVVAKDFYFGEAGGELHGHAYYGEEVDAECGGDDYGFCTHLSSPTAFRVREKVRSVLRLADLPAKLR